MDDDHHLSRFMLAVGMFGVGIGVERGFPQPKGLSFVLVIGTAFALVFLASVLHKKGY